MTSGVIIAVFCEGSYEEASRYRDFMGYPVPWYSVPQESVDRLIAGRSFSILVCYLRDGDRVHETYWTTDRGDEVMAPSYGLLDLTVYGRQEFWEDSPEGWPQHWGTKGGWLLAGFSVIEAESLEEVIDLVKNTPCPRARGFIEIRPFLDLTNDDT